MKLKNSLIIAFSSGAILIGAFWIYQNQQELTLHKVQAKEEQSALAIKFAQELINKSQPRASLAFFLLNERILKDNPDLEKPWNALMLNAAKELKDVNVLETLYGKDPTLITSEEDLSLLLAEHALLTNNTELYTALYDLWEPKSQNNAPWILLESDALTLRGKPEKAISLLKEHKFQNKKEEEKKRLIRLALLHENEHPKIAFDYLTQGFPFTREQEDLHYYRAKVLEEGPHHELALEEYQNAIKKNWDDPFYSDELIHAYLTQGKLQEAHMRTETALKNQLNGDLWLKGYFINNVCSPLSFDFAKNQIPEGNLTPLLRYLAALNPNEFWNESRLKDYPEVSKLSDSSPEILWLKVIFALNIGQGEQAFEILRDHPEIAKFSPDLYEALPIAIIYRHPELNITPLQTGLKGNSKHSIFTQLKKAPYSPSMQALLSSQDGYAALFLAAGWNEAALRTLEHSVLPQEFPKWIAYRFTQALLLNRGMQDALDFAVNQSPTPHLTLLIGELDLKLGHEKEAEKRLAPLLKSPTEIGAKAAKLLASFYASQGIFSKAKEAAKSNSQFASSVAGQELIASMDLKMGHIKEAEAVYKKIAGQSSVAKSYAAMQAFHAKKYPLAYKLTKELLDQYPHRQDLKEQLVEIQNRAKESN